MPSMRIGTTFRCDVAPTMPHMTSSDSLLRFFDGPTPSRNRYLPRSRNRQLGRRRAFHDRAAAADRRAAADLHRRNEQAIRPDVHVVADDRPMLVRAVVIRGDRSRAVVDVT